MIQFNLNYMLEYMFKIFAQLIQMYHIIVRECMYKTKKLKIKVKKSCHWRSTPQVEVLLPMVSKELNQKSKIPPKNIFVTNIIERTYNKINSSEVRDFWVRFFFILNTYTNIFRAKQLWTICMEFGLISMIMIKPTSI